MVKLAFSQSDITPEAPVYLCGYATRPGLSEGILDRIKVTAFILDFGANQLCMLSYDLAALDKDLSDAIRYAVSEKSGIPYDFIMATFTHTHSAPEVNDVSPFNKESKVLHGYRQVLIDKALEAVGHALEKGFIETELYMAKGEIEGYYSNRNDKGKPADKSVNILKFMDNKQKLLACIVNMACHSTVLGPVNTCISGDLFGYIRNGLQAQWGCTVMMSNGAAGDMSNRQYRQGNDAGELTRVGDGLLHQLTGFHNDTLIRTENTITMVKNFYDVNYTLDKEAIKKDLESIEKKLETETDYDQVKLYKSILAGAPMILGQENVDLSIDSYTYVSGDMAIVTVPGELFSKFGMEIKEASMRPYTILWGYCNQLLGYFVEKDEFGKYFESYVTKIPKGVPEKFTELVIGNLLKI